MTKGFYFDGENGKHNYFWDGKKMTGCTTILSILAKPALIQWAANMAVNYVKENSQTAKDAEVYIVLPTILEEARTAHRRKKEEAGQKGTDVHAEIEKLIKEAIEKTNGFIENWDGGNELDEKAKQIIHFIAWTQINKVKFLESEKRLYSEKLFIAGTCDFICEIRKKRYVGDIKTGGIYDRIPYFQTAAYRMMLQEMGEKDYFGSVIVNIKKDGKFDETKNIMWSFDYQTDLEGFLAALKIYRILKNY